MGAVIWANKGLSEKGTQKSTHHLSFLQTLVVEIEATFNNDQPLMYISSDSCNPVLLTPADLLHVRRLTYLQCREIEQDELMDPNIGNKVQIQEKAKNS